MRQTYIRVNGHGQIVERYRSDDSPPGADYFVVPSQEDRDLLQAYMLSGKILWRDGHVGFKPVIALTYNKQEHVAGEETALVTLSGIPDGYSTVAMQVGPSFVDLPAGEILEVSSDIPQHITVAVTEPTLWSEVLTLRFLPQGQI